MREPPETKKVGMMAVDSAMMRRIYRAAVEELSGEDHPYPVALILGIVLALGMKGLAPQRESWEPMVNQVMTEAFKIANQVYQHCEDNHANGPEGADHNCFDFREDEGEKGPGSRRPQSTFFTHDRSSDDEH